MRVLFLKAFTLTLLGLLPMVTPTTTTATLLLGLTRGMSARQVSEKDIEPLYLRKSILLVKPGNPKNIRGIEDLTRPGTGIIVNDGGGTSNTSGTGVWEDIAGRKGNIETVAGVRKNIILYAPNSGTARKALETQTGADVWITWADWAASNPGIGEMVEIAPDYVIWRDMNIAVRQDADAETRQFAAWLRSDEAAPAFKKYGWVRQATH